MTKLVKFPIDHSFKTRLQAIGFDIDDPERRHPTYNDFADRLRGQRQVSRGGKAAQLLADRHAHNTPDRIRVLPWLLPFVAGLGLPETARAHDHHMPDLPINTLDTSPRETVSIALPESVSTWFDSLKALDLSDPIWGLSIGAALLLTQAIAVFQRRAILKSTAAIAPPTQLELFELEAPKTPSDPSPKLTWQVDAATRRGQVRSENQDAFSIIQFEDGSHVLIICDGAGGVGGGREASQSAVAALERALRDSKLPGETLSTQELEAAIKIAREANLNEGQVGVTTALLVTLDDQEMRFATVGDGAVTIVWPDGMVSQVQVPHHTLGAPNNVIGAYIGGECDVPARTGSLRLESGCFVLAMTDGASDLLEPEDIARHREELRDITGLSDTLLRQLEAAKDADTGGWLHSDNMTLAVAKLGEAQ